MGSSTSFDNYALLLSGLVILLNAGLVLGIRVAQRWGRRSHGREASAWAGDRRILTGLAMAIIVVNAVVVVATFQLRAHKELAEAEQEEPSSLSSLAGRRF